MFVRHAFVAFALGSLLAPPLAAKDEPVDPARVKLVRAWLDSDGAERADAAEALKALDRVPVAEMARLIRAARPCPPQSGVLQRQVKGVKSPVPYQVRLPKDYDPAKSWPVMFWFSGPSTQADIGTWGELSDWILVSASLAPDNPVMKGYPKPDSGVVVFRQVLLDLATVVNYDADRVVAGGFSQGAVIAFWIAGFAPDRCAGGISGAGYSLFHFDNPGDPPLMGNMTHVPMYVFHGEADGAVPIKAVHETEAELKKYGCKYVLRILPGVGHEMPRTEMAKIREWLPECRRERYPKRVINTTGAAVNPAGRCFWIQLRAGGPGVMRVEAEVKEGNRIELKTQRVKALELLLSDELVDFGKEIVVEADGKELFRGPVDPSAKTMLESWMKDKDDALLYSATVPLKIP